MKKKKVSAIWTIILSVFFLYLLYQTAFAWSEEGTAPKKLDKIDGDKASFLMITDTHFGVQHSGIKSIEKKLEMWSYDKTKEKVYLKHPNLLPNEQTQMMVIYDRGYDSFEHHADVLSLMRFPYEHYFKNEPIFSVYGVDKNGDVYLSYKKQRIHLKPGESYYTVAAEGYKLTVTRVKNFGLYDKKQFALKDQKEQDSKTSNKPEKVNLDTIDTRPLKPSEKPTYDTESLVDIGY